MRTASQQRRTKNLEGSLTVSTKKSATSFARTGGSAANVREAGHWADRTLGETAEAAAKGNRAARRAIKIAKHAGRLGEEY